MQLQPPSVAYVLRISFTLPALLLIELLAFIHFVAFEQEQLTFVVRLVTFFIVDIRAIVKAETNVLASVRVIVLPMKLATQASYFDFPFDPSFIHIGFLLLAQK